MFGISSHLIRVLCDNPWEGGGGYTPAQVAEMTPDQAWARLCERDFLKTTSKSRKVKKMKPHEASMYMVEGGLVRGRSADGTPMLMPLSGKKQRK